VGLIIPWVYYYTDKNTAMLFAGLLVLGLLSVESLRLNHERFNAFLLKTFSKLAKSAETKRITGASYFFIGAAITIVLFDKPVAIAAITFSVFGDALATLVGTRWGRIHLVNGKTVEGGLASLAACLFASFLLVQIDLGLKTSILVVGAVVTAVIEILSSPLDDNLTIPILAGVLMQSMR